MRGQGNLPNIASDFSPPVPITRAQQYFPILSKQMLRSAIFSAPLEKNKITGCGEFLLISIYKTEIQLTTPSVLSVSSVVIFSTRSLKTNLARSLLYNFRSET
jgi:hypothetical protein